MLNVGQIMEQILIGKTKLNLNFEPQLSPNGRPLRLSGISLATTKPPIWIDKVLTHGTVYTFRYLDQQGGFVAFEFDANNKFIGKV
jgi:hypothetical protein